MNPNTKFADVEQRILLIRGQSVMLDFDLAPIYGVSTKRLNEQVRRNRERFPEDFMFQLSRDEARAIAAARYHPTTPKQGQHIKHLPNAFTVHGVVMLGNVVNSPIAVAASIQIVRAFNRLRAMVTANKELAVKLSELERKVESHDVRIHNLFETIRRFLEPSPEPPRQIGFKHE